ncbi:hypothetical protein PIIN_04986 [Serendipita indica DSM 11827]|uniref:Uncharacterized protein n=1 Tax=Serendipita indica (strain DSM 11827) TaxID=1109443 RepID=G4TIA5_SERID|nr:hypothetical protein PIIN_04986 [Serendipita indica DSM 11827]
MMHNRPAHLQRAIAVGSASIPFSAEIINGIWSKDGFKCGRVIESSFTPKPNLSTKRNCLVETVIDAYNQHHHLIIRPDDLWIAIISQFSY